MPWPNPYNGGQDNDLTRSIDNVHIEPSIREGLFLVPSLYGEDASRPLNRYPPVNLTQPFITGSGVIPNTLRCEIGVWDASPTADYFYQWMGNGVDIPGATGATITTDETFDGVILTCEVRAANRIGEDYAITSNSVLCSLIEPVEILEAEYFVITGTESDKLQTVLNKQDLILSGVGTDNRSDVMRSVNYFITGLWAKTRQDINAQSIIAINGLQQTDNLSVLDRDLGIAVINLNTGIPLINSIHQPIPIKNNNAEMGTLGWVNFGNVLAVGDTHDSSSTPPVEGRLSWFGGQDVHPEGNNTPYTSLSQDVEMWPLWHADIDAGTTFLEMTFLQSSQASAAVSDQANIKIEFYGADGTTLTGTNNGPGMWKSPHGVWFERNHECAIPPFTRFIRFIIEFSWDPVNGDNDINANIDNVKSYIRKGPKLTSADYGPAFNKIRLRFTQARSWSGSALSEVEFQNTFAGTNLATGGQILFGSAGLGAVNADAAFDGILSNYWAGAENSVAEGTSWVGYAFTAPQRPRAVAITARPGSDALQTGASFIVEGSDDGITWIPLEEYDADRVARAWNAGETRTFNIHTGTLPYMLEPPFVVPDTGYAPDNSDNYHTKGNVYKCMSRTRITHIKLGLMNQSHQYDWQIGKIIDFNNPLWYFGTVNEIHQRETDVTFTETGIASDDTTWVEIALASPFILEPGEYFIIQYHDRNMAGNPNTVANNGNSPDQGRLKHITNYNGQDIPDRNPWCRLIDGWQSNAGLTDTGGRNDTGPPQSGQGFQMAIDFKGNFY